MILCPYCDQEHETVRLGPVPVAACEPARDEALEGL